MNITYLITIKSKEKGVTLAELLIAVVLVILVFLGVTSVDIASREFSILTSRKAEIQNEDRISMEHMVRNIREGYGLREPPGSGWVRVEIDDNQPDPTLIKYILQGSELRYYGPNITPDWDGNYEVIGRGISDLDFSGYDAIGTPNLLPIRLRATNGNLEINLTSAVTLRNYPIIGSALDFDGIDDYVDLPSILDPSTTNFTAELWFKLDVLPSLKGSNENLIQQRDGSGSAGRTWIFVASAGDQIRSFLGGANRNSGVIAVAGRWYHVAIVWNGSSLQWYIDGQVGNFANFGMEFADGGHVFGASKVLTDAFLDGQIDEVRIWNDVRTQTEIQQNMFRIVNPSEDHLIGYWRLNEGTGQIAYDGTINNNDGILGPTPGPDSNDPRWTPGRI